MTLDCDAFRRAHLTERMFEGEIPTGDVSEDDVREHLRVCPDCGDWYRARIVEERGEDPAAFPCVHLAYFVTRRCPEHPDAFECPETVVLYQPEFDEYALPVRTEPPSLVPISHCPWCGTALPASRREEWVERLATLGITDPANQEVPEAYRSDRWWREAPGAG
jgi:hypothetical protein